MSDQTIIWRDGIDQKRFMLGIMFKYVVEHLEPMPMGFIGLSADNILGLFGEEAYEMVLHLKPGEALPVTLTLRRAGEPPASDTAPPLTDLERAVVEEARGIVARWREWWGNMVPVPEYLGLASAVDALEAAERKANG